MSDQSKLGLGHIITTEQNRDAVHIAVAPVTAGEMVSPGINICIKDGKAFAERLSDEYPDAIGVVDPFLRKNVRPGERFWLFLYPGSITSLRHEWSHPSFQDSVPIVQPVGSPSEKWLREFAERVDADYDEMMAIASTHCGQEDYGDHLCEGGKWEGQSTPDEFWTHYTNVTGKSPKTTYGLPGIFSCSC